MNMNKYKFKPSVGKHDHYVDGKLKTLKPGDVVELSDEGYESFSDKFEPVSGKDTDPNPKVTPTQPQEPVGRPKDAAPKASTTTAASGQTGAGAAANSSNSAKV